MVMTAQRRTRKTGKMPRKAKIAALAGTALLAAAAAALALWGTLPREAASGATVSTYRSAGPQEIQQELDRQVRESMMTVAVSPACTLTPEGTVNLRVVNAEDNDLAQSFTLLQEGRELYRSPRIDPGEEILSCQAEGAKEGAAVIAVQGLDPQSGKPYGSPAAVEVTLAAESA